MSLRRGHGCPPRTTEVDETVGSASRGLARYLFHQDCRRGDRRHGKSFPTQEGASLRLIAGIKAAAPDRML